MPLKITPGKRGDWQVDEASQTIIYAEEMEDPRWRTLFVFAPVQGQIALVELTLLPTAIWEGRTKTYDDDLVGGITARMLREIKVGRAIANTAGGLKHLALDPFLTATRRKELLQLLAPSGWKDVVLEPPSRPGRAGRDDSYYVVWAHRYRLKIEEGSTKPIIELAEEHGLTSGQVRDLVHKARQRDLLTPGTRGTSGGSLTPKAQALIKELQERGSG